VSDYEALDFMVVIRGSMSLEFEEGVSPRLTESPKNPLSTGGAPSVPNPKKGGKIMA
jgi:hypothetical protein